MMSIRKTHVIFQMFCNQVEIQDFIQKNKQPMCFIKQIESYGSRTERIRIGSNLAPTKETV